MKFRKKPVVIEARPVVGRYTYTNPKFEELAAWCGGGIADYGRAIAIETLEGTMMAYDGDWIVRGTEGEFYPVKPAAFAATFEAVE